MMTVRELIEELEKLDQDTDVVYFDSERQSDFSIERLVPRQSKPSGMFPVVAIEGF